MHYKTNDENCFVPGSLQSQLGPALPVNITCPHCRRMGTFAAIGGDIAYTKPASLMRDNMPSLQNQKQQHRFGTRVCPNLECQGLVAVITALTPDNQKWEVVSVAPPVLIDFATDNIPPKIRDAMTEALASHSVRAYRASALMVRRTLELLCEEKQATGPNLQVRLQNLSRHAVLSPSLIAAADHLRILGNDAAHVEAREYDDIGQEHSALAIEITREILKAVYQHDDLISRLTKLKA
jgi:hypothetical protein